MRAWSLMRNLLSVQALIEGISKTNRNGSVKVRRAFECDFALKLILSCASSNESPVVESERRVMDCSMKKSLMKSPATERHVRVLRTKTICLCNERHCGVVVFNEKRTLNQPFYLSLLQSHLSCQHLRRLEEMCTETGQQTRSRKRKEKRGKKENGNREGQVRKGRNPSAWFPTE